MAVLAAIYLTVVALILLAGTERHTTIQSEMVNRANRS